MAAKKEAAVEATTVSSAPAEKKYRLSKLRADCRNLFGVSGTCFDGATANMDDGEYTIAEVKNVIEKWRRKEVKR